MWKNFSPVLDQTMPPMNIRGGFIGTGIYPINPNFIPEEAYAPGSVTLLPNNVHDKEPQPSTSGHQICSSIEQFLLQANQKQRQLPPSSSESDDSSS